MGIEIETKMTEHLLKAFSGGHDKGVCLQVTSLTSDDYIQLDYLETMSLISGALQYLQEETKRLNRNYESYYGKEHGIHKECLKKLEAAQYCLAGEDFEYLEFTCPKIHREHDK